jgi:hypothetical protein
MEVLVLLHHPSSIKKQNGHQGTQSPLTSTPALSSNSRPALVPEEEDLADDWLDDDLGEVVQARKKRRVGGGDSQTKDCGFETQSRLSSFRHP